MEIPALEGWEEEGHFGKDMYDLFFVHAYAYKASLSKQSLTWEIGKTNENNEKTPCKRNFIDLKINGMKTLKTCLVVIIYVYLLF